MPPSQGGSQLSGTLSEVSQEGGETICATGPALVPTTAMLLQNWKRVWISWVTTSYTTENCKRSVSHPTAQPSLSPWSLYTPSSVQWALGEILWRDSKDNLLSATPCHLVSGIHTKCYVHFKAVVPLLLQIKGDYPISGKLHCLSRWKHFWEVRICGKTECLWVLENELLPGTDATPSFKLFL